MHTAISGPSLLSSCNFWVFFRLEAVCRVFSATTSTTISTYGPAVLSGHSFHFLLGQAGQVLQSQDVFLKNQLVSQINPLTMSNTIKTRKWFSVSFQRSWHWNNFACQECPTMTTNRPPSFLGDPSANLWLKKIFGLSRNSQILMAGTVMYKFTIMPLQKVYFYKRKFDNCDSKYVQCLRDWQCNTLPNLWV